MVERMLGLNISVDDRKSARSVAFPSGASPSAVVFIHTGQYASQSTHLEVRSQEGEGDGEDSAG
jgi:hypothetical protein